MSATVFFEKMFYSPGAVHKSVSALLIPFSLLYGILMFIRRKVAKRYRFEIPVISVGNLVLGGSGKTPFVIELARRYGRFDVAIVSRGYGRKSRGLMVVSKRGKIVCDVQQSGDEAMLMAESLPRANVIVAEDRKAAVKKAIELDSKLIIIDDGFNRVDIEKFEIVLEPAAVSNRLVIPSGPFREFPFTVVYSDLFLKEGRDFRRSVHIESPSEKMVLVTAIANPDRLESFLPDTVVARYLQPDHSWFSEEEIRAMLDKHRAQSVLVTEKDLVKLKDFKLPFSVMKLQLLIEDFVFAEIDDYLKGNR